MRTASRPLPYVVLAVAMCGILPLAAMRDHTARYQRAGGRGSFADYYTARFGSALVAPELTRNIVLPSTIWSRTALSAKCTSSSTAT